MSQWRIGPGIYMGIIGQQSWHAINFTTVDTTTVEGDTDSPLDELWQEDLEQWIEDYDNWRDHVDEQGPPLVSTPQYSISGPPYSAAWLQLFGNWTQDFVYYNTTYYDTC